MGPRTILTVGSYSDLERDALERLFTSRMDGGITVYLAEPEPMLPDLTITVPMKQKGAMPIPTGKRKKFKPSRHRRRK